MPRQFHLAVALTCAALLAGCGGSSKAKMLGKYAPGKDNHAISTGATMTITADQLILTLKSGKSVTWNYKVLSEDGSLLTLEISGGIFGAPKQQKVVIAKDGITFQEPYADYGVFIKQWDRM